MKVKLLKNIIRLGQRGQVLDVDESLGSDLVARNLAEKTWSRKPKSKKKK